MVSKVPHDPNEVIALVNDKDEVIGSEKRGIVHEKGLKHREVCAFIINSKKEVLFQQRVGSGNWDDSCSGHFQKIKVMMML